MSLSCVVVCNPSGSRPGLISMDAAIHLGAFELVIATSLWATGAFSRSRCVVTTWGGVAECGIARESLGAARGSRRTWSGKGEPFEPQKPEGWQNAASGVPAAGVEGGRAMNLGSFRDTFLTIEPLEQMEQSASKCSAHILTRLSGLG